MRVNVRNPEPRVDNAEVLDFNFNPFPGGDVVPPPLFEGDCLRLHQIKSKTGTLNIIGGKRLAEQMRQIRMDFPGAEIYFHASVDKTLRGHRSMGGMLRVEPSLIVQFSQASFRVLTESESGAALLVRVYQAAVELAAEQTGHSVENMTRAIVQTFIERAEAEGEGCLESGVHQSTRGDAANLDSRSYTGGRSRAWVGLRLKPPRSKGNEIMIAGVAQW